MRTGRGVGRESALALVALALVALACSQPAEESAPAGEEAAATALDAPTPAEAGSVPEDLLDPEALAVAHRAGDFLRGTQRFRFSAQSGYEVVQDDGSKLEFGSARRYTVQRPDRVRVETDGRDGGRRLTLFDGTTFVQVDLDENAYARAALRHPRDIDFVIDLVRDRLNTPLPLAELIRNDPRQALEDSLESADWIGSERLRGVDCDHVALRNPDADLELWIEQGERPLMRRLVIRYRNEPGQPSFWADLRDWELAPDVDDASFRFVPPEGAERVPLEVLPAPRTDEELAP